jgi:uncharacterized protein YuzE
VLGSTVGVLLRRTELVRTSLMVRLARDEHPDAPPHAHPSRATKALRQVSKASSDPQSSEVLSCRWNRGVMRIEYGPKYDIANVSFVDVIEDGAIVEDVCVHRPGADLYLGFTADGRLMEIEILGASRVLAPETLRAASTMDETSAHDEPDEDQQSTDEDGSR